MRNLNTEMMLYLDNHSVRDASEITLMILDNDLAPSENDALAYADVLDESRLSAKSVDTIVYMECDLYASLDDEIASWDR